MSAITFGGACSLINSFDDVKQHPSSGGSGPGSSSSSTASATSSASSSSSTGMGGAASSSSSSSSSSSGKGGTGGTGGGKPLGVLVAGGYVLPQATMREIVTLDPATGAQLTTAPVSVIGLAYDGLQDVFFAFDGPNFPAGPQDKVTLHVAKVDPTTGAWNEIGSLANVPVPRDARTITVLNGRLVYRAYDPTSDAGFPPTGLAVIDTSKPQKPVLASFGGFLAVQSFVGFVGTPATNAGGYVNLLISNCDTSDAGADMDAGTCSLERQNIIFGQDPAITPSIGAQTAAAVIPVAPNKGSTTVSAANRRAPQDEDILVYPPIAGQMDSWLLSFNPLNAAKLDQKSFQISPVNQYTALVVAECMHNAIFQEVSQAQLVAEPLGAAGTPAIASLPHAASSIAAFEPITSTVVLPFNPPNADLVAYRLGGSEFQPSLTQRKADWAPPKGVQFDLVVARLPLPFDQASCP